METKQPFCIALEEGLIIAIFNDELADLQDYAMDAGGALWYILGTDAWLELQTVAAKPALVARSYDKNYFTCFVSDEIAEKIKANQESSIIVLSSAQELKPQDILTALKANSTLDDIGEWIEDSIANGMDINGLIFCYYAKEARKRHHGSDYAD
jgi:hypothetical protein